MGGDSTDVVYIKANLLEGFFNFSWEGKWGPFPNLRQMFEWTLGLPEGSLKTEYQRAWEREDQEKRDFAVEIFTEVWWLYVELILPIPKAGHFVGGAQKLARIIKVWNALRKGSGWARAILWVFNRWKYFGNGWRLVRALMGRPMWQKRAVALALLYIDAQAGHLIKSIRGARAVTHVKRIVGMYYRRYARELIRNRAAGAQQASYAAAMKGLKDLYRSFGVPWPEDLPDPSDPSTWPALPGGFDPNDPTTWPDLPDVPEGP